MTMLKKMTVVVTAVDILAPETLNASPFMGGQGRKAILEIPTLPLTSVFKLQGAGRQDSGAAPAEGSDEWTDIVEIDANSDKLQEIELPFYIRANVTTLDADGPDVEVFLRGVQ